MDTDICTPNNVERGEARGANDFNFIQHSSKQKKWLLKQSLNGFKFIQHRFNFGSSCFNTVEKRGGRVTMFSKLFCHYFSLLNLYKIAVNLMGSKSSYERNFSNCVEKLKISGLHNSEDHSFTRFHIRSLIYSSFHISFHRYWDPSLLQKDNLKPEEILFAKKKKNFHDLYLRSNSLRSKRK